MGFDAFPSELIFEILSRTSLETLEPCKAVSKSWRNIINESTFLPLHSQRTNSLFGYFFQDVKHTNKYPSAFVSSAAGAAAAIKGTWPCDDMKILASCDQGILCCQRQICHKNTRYYTCKPATSQWQALPNPKLRYETASVAVVVVQSSPLRYIIVRLYKYNSRGGMQYHCEIFDSEIWAWEKIECACPYGEIINPCHAAVTAGGGRSVQWLTDNDNVVALDITEKRFRCFPLPEVVRCNEAYKCKQLMEYEGGLGLICVVEDGDRSKMEVWAAEGRKMVVDMRAVGESLRHPQTIELWSSDVVFMRTAEGAAFYNLQGWSFDRVEVPHDVRNPQQIFRFRSDLEMVDLKGGRSKINELPQKKKCRAEDL